MFWGIFQNQKLRCHNSLSSLQVGNKSPLKESPNEASRLRPELVIIVSTLRWHQNPHRFFLCEQLIMNVIRRKGGRHAKVFTWAREIPLLTSQSRHKIRALWFFHSVYFTLKSYLSNGFLPHLRWLLNGKQEKMKSFFVNAKTEKIANNRESSLKSGEIRNN